jgi:hypothetical protein
MRAYKMLIAVGIFVAACAPAADQKVSIHDEAVRAALGALPSHGLRVEFLGSITNLPASVRERLAGVVDKGGPYFDGCNGGRRFVTATKTGGTYNVGVEQGGLVSSWFIMQFTVNTTGKVIREDRIERTGSANRSHPIPRATNQPPAPAGSGR